ncbi:cysteine--tRNA ligase [Zavarzinia compransoris]|uniref:Cysteine--tRNA ligase n=1 Tax=Zavarzinia compransoris TaxID=1264899 RepID=A0A317E966_9PROT|nr:cysteine--tRNA ligase [Zavarzinia compransoris]PWR23638.1 cysteine--tRNA ligase [Zavarzinia compransoris]TDP47856.1 cysteinyl-tRNA synthetase [Zavarzinia compransoris]
MVLVLHNGATGKREEFIPLRHDAAGMYVCGPTVYDFAHIGNARPVIVFDVLYRLLKRRYAQVRYVRNITDIDDKINARAAQSGEPIAAITARTTAAFHEDMAALGSLPPDAEPRATAHIGNMIAMIERLVERGYAYVAEGHVLFSVAAKADYGKLSNRSRDELIAGARVDVAPYKRDPADFTLWKPSDAETPGWNSPWGRGRPGWHIECSAMSLAELGKTFDIHGGGRDLVFPHHENEVAQSEAANGAPFVRYWVHNGFLTVNGEKMSKSLGNFVVVRDALAKAPGEALRLNMLSTHYRAPIDWNDEGIVRARQALDRWYGLIEKAEAHLGRAVAPLAEVPAGVEAALDDDLNTPLAIAELHGIANAGYQCGTGDALVDAATKLKAAGHALGILFQDPHQWFRWQPAGAEAGPTDDEIETLIEARKQARKNRDFAAADRIRDDLAGQGVILEDSAAGTKWKRT